MSPLGIGNDGLGSLRHPAQCCGVAALKPTLGRVPHATSVEPDYAPIGMQLTTVVGPLARRVADLQSDVGPLVEPSRHPLGRRGRHPAPHRSRCSARAGPRSWTPSAAPTAGPEPADLHLAQRRRWYAAGSSASVAGLDAPMPPGRRAVPDAHGGGDAAELTARSGDRAGEILPPL